MRDKKKGVEKVKAVMERKNNKARCGSAAESKIRVTDKRKPEARRRRNSRDRSKHVDQADLEAYKNAGQVPRCASQLGECRRRAAR